MKASKIFVASVLALGAGAVPFSLHAEATPDTTTGSAVTSITGTVTDTEGEPLIGASIRAKDSTIGVATDLDGNFSLNVAPGTELIVTYVGYDTAIVKAQPGMVITMYDNAKVLDEVVVVGFGTQKKVNLTGAVSVADSKVLSERPVASAAAALQGVVPGLNIGLASGSLESNPSMNIRGAGTIGDGSSGSPLILIDGFEGDINLINPQDIESISVLKDAAAASIYGSRAPFGVILITTKKGKEGRAVINYNNSFRFNNLINKAKTMDSFSFVKFYNDGCMNTNGWQPHFKQDQIDRIIAYQKGELDASIIPDPNNPSR